MRATLLVFAIVAFAAPAVAGPAAQVDDLPQPAVSSDLGNPVYQTGPQQVPSSELANTSRVAVIEQERNATAHYDDNSSAQKALDDTTKR